ncbi:substrate-binding domain-containing protein [Rhizobium gallicum]|uniref:substrate-binding domain-containing protein n=1 Tax=Rhizobium gallicum TaxID=56730 RepID=UPI003AAD40DB
MLLRGPSYASSSRGSAEDYKPTSMKLGYQSIRPTSFHRHSALIRIGGRRNSHAGRAAATAIFAVNDNTATGGLSGLARPGPSVPDDLSLVGCNDIPIVSHLTPPLTTLRVSFDQIASNALDLLGRAIPNEDRIRVSAPTLAPVRSRNPVTMVMP